MLPAIRGIEQFLAAAGWAVRPVLKSLLFRRRRGRGEDVDLLHVLGVPGLDDLEDGVCNMLRLETE